MYLFFLTNSKIISLSIADRRRYTRRRAPIAIQTYDQLPNAASAFTFIDGTLYCSSSSLSRIFCQWELIRREEVNEEQKKRKSERWREHNPHNMQVLTNVRDVEWTKESTEFLSSMFIERWWSAVRPFYFSFFSFNHLFNISFCFFWPYRHHDLRWYLRADTIIKFEEGERKKEEKLYIYNVTLSFFVHRLCLARDYRRKSCRYFIISRCTKSKFRYFE